MRKKQIYEAPEAEAIVVKFEGNFCATGDDQQPGGVPQVNPNNIIGDY